MDFRVLEARAFSSAGTKALSRIVKDYEIDIERGDGRCYCYNGQKYRLSRGDILIRKPGGTVHSIGPQSSYILTLDFSDSAPRGSYSRNVYGPQQTMANDPCLQILPPVIRPRDTVTMLELYRTLTSITDRNGIAAKSLVKELLLLLFAELAHREFEENRPKETAIEQAIHFMASNLEKRITLDDLCTVVHLDKSYFIRLFRTQTGKTPIELLVEMRLDHANDLVVTSNLRIAEIAEACGYRTVSFFISEYKKRFGHTPNAQRNKIASNGEDGFSVNDFEKMLT